MHLLYRVQLYTFFRKGDIKMDQEIKQELESVLGGSLENTYIEDMENIDKTSIDWYTTVEEESCSEACSEKVSSTQHMEIDDSKSKNSKSEKKNACESYTSKYVTSKKRYNPQNSKKFKGGAPDLSSVEAAIIDGNDVRRDIADLLN